MSSVPCQMEPSSPSSVLQGQDQAQPPHRRKSLQQQGRR